MKDIIQQRPWGSFIILEEGVGYKIKRLEILPGHRLSLQRHKHRSEHWVVVTGTALITRNNEVFTHGPNEYVFIPSMVMHRLENKSKEILTIIEVQHGHYLEEDDIERFADDYSR